MADTKITGMTAATALARADLVAVVQNVATTPVNKKATLQQLAFVRSAPPVFERTASTSASVTKGQFFTPTQALTVHGLGFVGNWVAADTYRLRIVELDGLKNVVATPIDETVSPSVSGYSEVTALTSSTVELSAGTQYAAMVTVQGKASTFVCPVTWPIANPLPWLPATSGASAGFRISNLDPTSLASPDATADPSLQWVLYWMLT